MPLLTSRRYSPLPVELWRKILRHATEESASPPEDLLLHPLSFPRRRGRGPSSLSTKRSLSLVSSQFRQLSLEYLWESVGNQSQDQLVHIARLLKRPSTQPHKGWWIRALHTRFDFGDNLDVYVQSVCDILAVCPHLHTFVHVHDFNGPLPTAVVQALTDLCGSTLRNFQLDWGGVNIDDLILLLDNSPNLQHLSLGCTFAPLSETKSQQIKFPYSFLPPEISDSTESSLVLPIRRKLYNFPDLSSLHFGNTEDGMTRRFNCHLLEASLWCLPSLTSISIEMDCRTSVDELIGFLQVHGSRLSSLSLTDSGRIDGLPLSWEDIFGFCKNLVELRISVHPFLRLTAGGGGGGEVAEGNTSRALVSSSIAAKLERLCFAQWEFFPLSDELLEITSSNPSTTAASSLPASVPYLQRILDSEFEPIGGHLTPSLKVIQFDFYAGKLDIPEFCMEWWTGWVRKWSKERGIAVEGCDREALDA